LNKDLHYGIISLEKVVENMECECVNSQDIKTLTLLLQVRLHNNGVENDFLENQILDLITSLKMQNADLNDIISICTRYDYNLKGN